MRCSQQIVVRVPAALRETIETVAAAEGRTLSNATRRILEDWLAQHRPSEQPREGASA